MNTFHSLVVCGSGLVNILVPIFFWIILVIEMQSRRKWRCLCQWHWRRWWWRYVAIFAAQPAKIYLYRHTWNEKWQNISLQRSWKSQSRRGASPLLLIFGENIMRCVFHLSSFLSLPAKIMVYFSAGIMAHIWFSPSFCFSHKWNMPYACYSVVI